MLYADFHARDDGEILHAIQYVETSTTENPYAVIRLGDEREGAQFRLFADLHKLEVIAHCVNMALDTLRIAMRSSDHKAPVPEPVAP